MKLGKWVIGIAILGLFLGGSATAQLYGPHQPNEHLLHAGTQSWYGNAAFYGYPNHAVGKYYPSFTHWAGTSDPNSWATPPFTYPWKIDGWAWTTFKQVPAPGVDDGFWWWTTTLMKSRDNPYNINTAGFDMSFDYPEMMALGMIPKIGVFPSPMYGATFGAPPALANDHMFLFPSSYGGFNASWNVFAYYEGPFILPPAGVGALWVQGFAGNCTNPITLPSGYSVYESVWMNRPEHNQQQYISVDGNEFSCYPTQAATGRYGCNYSYLADVDNGWYWAWGPSVEAGFDILVCDIITMQPNIPGNDGPMNPYGLNGFDLGTSTIMPIATLGCEFFTFLSIGNQNAGVLRVAVGEISGFFDWVTSTPPSALPWNIAVPYGPAGVWRIPHRWGTAMNALLKGPWIFIFSHLMVPANYGGYLFGSQTGGNASGVIPIPGLPVLKAVTWRFSSIQFAVALPGQQAGPHSASFMAVWF